MINVFKQVALYLITVMLWLIWDTHAKDDPLKFDKIEFADEFSKEELEILRLTNHKRKKRGLKPLTMNKDLAEVARAQSNDMAQHHHLSHTVQGKHLGFRIRQSGYSYRAVGENIAMSKGTFKHVIRMWMKSPVHRKNILNRHYEELGVGITKAKNGDLYFTQVFGAQR
jgi:uncharacterized protein YkwD